MSAGDASQVSLPPALVAALTPLGSVCVALSGGVDSSVVLVAATAVLGREQVVGLTVVSPLYVAEELEDARSLCLQLGCRHEVIPVDHFGDERFVVNPPDRCYYCKARLCDEMMAVAGRLGCQTLLDGVNNDDLADYRPGLRAADERGVRHPLLEAGLGKADVRALARSLGLAIWDKPANACLASRIPYKEAITPQKLRAVAAAEAGLHAIGFRQCRVRHHGVVARVEVPLAELPRAAGELRGRVVAAVRAAGFAYVTLDLGGLRTGSLNEVLAGER